MNVTGCDPLEPKYGLAYNIRYELGLVAQFLGERECENVNKDISDLKSAAYDLNYTANLDLESWVNDRNKVVVGLLKGLAHTRSNCNAPTDLYRVAKNVEQIYSLTNPYVVLPLSFSENVLIYSIVQSKLTANVYGLTSPGGSYWTVRNWLKGLSMDPLPTPRGDCLVAFDNDQVIGKSYNVRENNKVKTSIVTSVCVAEVDPDGKLQNESSLRPSCWERSLTSSEALCILDQKHVCNEHFCSVADLKLKNALQEKIELIKGQQICSTCDNEQISDDIDVLLKDEKMKKQWKVCSHCDTQNLKSKRNCDNCKKSLKVSSSKLSSSETTTTKVTHAQKVRVTEILFDGTQGSLKPQNKETETKGESVSPRDPIFVNPNSFETVKTVLISIGKDFCIRVICDGLPYTLALKVIAKTFHCNSCNTAVFGEDEFKQHCKNNHHTAEKDVVYQKEFGWVHLRIGYGHMEMNMVRSFFSLNWEIVLKDLALSMGFRSEIAQKYALKGSDHHKSWELLNIFYHGTMSELLLPYIRKCMKSVTEPTSQGYLNWSKSVTDPNYQYMQEQVLRYAQAIINFREGIRNNWSLIKTGLFKFAPLFHARNHPKYQQIELREAINEMILPEPLHKFVGENQSLGKKGKMEDMDFQLENVNKRSKSWNPVGVPTEEDWMRTFRNLKKLDQLRCEVLERIGCNDPRLLPNTESRHDVKQNEITAWRKRLRETGYLMNPMTERVMMSTMGDELDAQLPDFTSAALSRRKAHFKITYQPNAASEIPEPVFVTPQERLDYHDIANQTKSVISNRIKELLEKIQHSDTRNALEDEWNSFVKQQKKADYFTFFAKVKDELDSEQFLAKTDSLSEQEYPEN
ncbi:hypothetical protein HOLleu_27195 [Holothuria leucospilota]|uniref:C2H2-type domain-containing protein n=1 Tax=Holothuria leucospilota TaxID=206669 RepID=A0A9Q1BQE3_HOLLE|nr:hypothetical protein HOLleu_27195 [Holothuria leucospilota]